MDKSVDVPVTEAPVNVKLAVIAAFVPPIVTLEVNAVFVPVTVRLAPVNVTLAPENDKLPERTLESVFWTKFAARTPPRLFALLAVNSATLPARVLFS